MDTMGLQGGATFTVGAVGQAFLFDGVDDSVLSDVVLPSVGFLEFWVNPTSLSHRGPRKFSWELTGVRTGTIASGWCRAVLLAVRVNPNTRWSIWEAAA